MTTKQLKQRTDAEWQQEIEQVQMPLRAKLARIVWFDYLSERPASKACQWVQPYLDCCLKLVHKPERVLEGLMQIGYDRKDALKRYKPALNHTQYERRARKGWYAA